MAVATAIGVDIGGTFTDVVGVDETGALRLAKIPSTRADPSEAVRRVLSELLPEWRLPPAAVRRFAHGTTVATNAVLERKGARLGLLATEGFTDILEIGRQNRRQLYELMLRPETPGFLAPGARRLGVIEGIGPDGGIETPLDRDSLARAVAALVADGVEAIAICFLFSFANPVHGQEAAAYIRARHPDIAVSLSSEVDPAFREYERSCVTAFDAYVKPRLDAYLDAMERDLAGAGIDATLQVMQSRGGVCSAAVARRRPIRLFLSGPAAGVIGARAVGVAHGHRDLITLDVGGTSSDIALIADGQALIRPDGVLDGYRIRVPMVDVNSIGAGGGSIAWIDSGGGLRVGPHSAGADPGPACYGRGGPDATVTDASVVLGLLDPAYFAGGMLRLDPDRAAEAVQERVARPLGLGVEEAALGIHRVVNVQMAEGIRLVSIGRGIDPRGFTLVAFGGAGPLHATSLAAELGIGTILIPRFPGVLSAAGLLAAPVEHEAAAAFLRPLDATQPEEVLRVLAALHADCTARMAEEGIAPEALQTRCFADLCYVGQAWHLEVPLDLDGPDRLLAHARAAFRQKHELVYGHATDAPTQFVNLRVVQQRPQPGLPLPSAATGGASYKGERRIRVAGSAAPVIAAIHARDRLVPGQALPGPAIVEQADTTTLIEPGWTGLVQDDLVLVLTREA